MKYKNSSTEFSLKIIALIFMVIDHIHTYLGIGPEWISLLPRFVAPLFVYFLVEGFYYTSNWKKYFLRIFVFSLIMMIGNIFINYMFHSTNPLTHQMDFYSLYDGNNIFQTLAIYLIILKLLNLVKINQGIKKYFFIVGAIVLSLISIPFSEGSIYLLPLLLIFYFGFKKKKIIYLGIIIWSSILFLKALMSYYSMGTGISLYSTLCFDNEWAIISTIIPIYLYSGKRGNNSNLSKWMFYVIYPVHLWILKILSYLIF